MFNSASFISSAKILIVPNNLVRQFYHGSKLCTFNRAYSKPKVNLVRLQKTSFSTSSFWLKNENNHRWFKLPLLLIGIIGGSGIFYIWYNNDEPKIKAFPKLAISDQPDKGRRSFQDRTVIEYENRIRSYSTPDKIFRYFATIRVVYDDHETEVFMTPDDFLRAVTPGIRQPENLGLEKFRKVEVGKETSFDFGLKSDSIFYKLSHFGLINYSDFLFLLTLLSVSHRHFKIAFRMFDLNGDGNVDYEEFEKVQNAILHQTSIGQKLGSQIKTNYRGVSSALAKYFFGPDLKEKLTIQKFLDFQKQLQDEMLTLEFDRKGPTSDGKISETKFAELMIAYAGFPEKKKNQMIKRIKKTYPSATMDQPDRGITLKDYLTFHHFLQNINDVDIALTFYNIAGASIDEDTFRHAAKTVANVELRDHLIKVIFILFDENEDGQLSNKEFIAVMKERLKRGLGRPKDTGFIKVMSAIWTAMKNELF
ncbi:calcium uptake protein 1 homolog, mitochondrial isoform X2 [Tetranychus urticae]|uniref:calcium uptake protein 1 homolog, mitochondrial isoform X2 n=1 Tax=Tetranychus urticae TaxID=32264 RepID=UPI00077BDBD5|nr:calcium uptake protein 1 homolog, mitochondrial isoform X2 [Tetranychus urticae]